MSLMLPDAFMVFDGARAAGRGGGAAKVPTNVANF
jgi:hypothetical protein